MKQTFAQETFYTPEEVAQRLKLSLTTIYNLIKSRDIPAIRIGKCFRISESEISGFLSGKKPVIPQTAANFADQLKLAPFAKKIIDVILFGSYARGEPDEDSDIDIILIYAALSENEREALISLEDSVSESTGYKDEMNVIKRSVLQWKNMEENGTNFFKIIKREGISLWKK